MMLILYLLLILEFKNKINFMHHLIWSNQLPQIKLYLCLTELYGGFISMSFSKNSRNQVIVRGTHTQLLILKTPLLLITASLTLQNFIMDSTQLSILELPSLDLIKKCRPCLYTGKKSTSSNTSSCINSLARLTISQANERLVAFNYPIFPLF